MMQAPVPPQRQDPAIGGPVSGSPPDGADRADGPVAMPDPAAPHGGQIAFPFPDPPAPGTMAEVAPGILWTRLPLPMKLDHVNVYALDDGAGWTIIDTGMDTEASRAVWGELLAGPLAGRPITRIVLTHHHPDHIGLVGWLARDGVEVLTSRTAWLYARALTLDVQDRPLPAALAFQHAAGTPPDRLAEKAARRPFNFADCTAPLPPSYTRLVEGGVLHAAGRDWRVRMGGGHAPEHVTLWSQHDALVIAGDQILPGISPNIGVHYSEPEADPLAEWLTACADLAPHAQPDHLVLPGHKLPFTGLALRLRQLAENHHGALARLLVHLATPRRAPECFGLLFQREIGPSTFDLALGETLAHLNHLCAQGLARRTQDADGVWLWQSVAPPVTPAGA